MAQSPAVKMHSEHGSTLTLEDLCVQRQQKESQGAGAVDAAPADTGSQGAKERSLRTFGQKRAKADPAGQDAPALAPDVLALIAGKK